MQPKEICRQFNITGIRSVEKTDIGHINNTSIILAESGKFVLQRMQRKMDINRLEHNYSLYSKVCGEQGWLCPVWCKTVGDRYFYTDDDGSNWRMYPFIEGEILSAPLAEVQLYECGQGIARMHEIFGSIEGEPEAVYPKLHDLAYYYDEYKRVIEGCGKRDTVLEEIIEADIGVMLKNTKEEDAIVHGDTKISNLIFRNGHIVGCLDMDTFMRGSRREDLADSIRSCCVKDGRFDRKAAGYVISGYRSAGDKGTVDDLPDAFNKICFELGLRYYTDSVSDHKHFIEKYPGYRLERAKSMLKLRWE